MKLKRELEIKPKSLGHMTFRKASCLEYSPKKDTIKSEYHSTNHTKYKYSRMSCPSCKRALQKGDSVDINNNVLLLKVLYFSLPECMFVIKF